jgi:hypothetical protein
MCATVQRKKPRISYGDGARLRSIHAAKVFAERAQIRLLVVYNRLRIRRLDHFSVQDDGLVKGHSRTFLLLPSQTQGVDVATTEVGLRFVVCPRGVSSRLAEEAQGVFRSLLENVLRISFLEERFGGGGP